MQGKQAITCFSGLVVLAALNSGCALRSLKEANQRLRESNDRLISENNRLEHELAQLQRAFQGEPGGGSIRPASAVPDLPGMNTEILPEVVTTVDAEGIHMRIPDRVFFGLGQAKLSRQGQSVLRRIATVLEQQYPGRQIRVEGHTDDVPVRKVRHLYPSNWELSTARACMVVRYLVDNGGISPQRIYPVGFAYHRPLVRGSGSRARSQNRRVEITILNKPI
ncbi:MAG: OmpA family protein [Planctomycetota bacterium]|nr:OmpA family protein [Planctomycetota bacterium]